MHMILQSLLQSNTYDVTRKRSLESSGKEMERRRGNNLQLAASARYMGNKLSCKHGNSRKRFGRGLEGVNDFGGMFTKYFKLSFTFLFVVW